MQTPASKKSASPSSIDSPLDDVNLLTPIASNLKDDSDLYERSQSRPPLSPLYVAQERFRSKSISYPINTPHLKLKSRKTLFMQDNPDKPIDDTSKVSTTQGDKDDTDIEFVRQKLIKEQEEQRLRDAEYTLRPRIPGRTAPDIECPTRDHFLYVYRNIHHPELYEYIQGLQKWLVFVLEHKLYPNYALPILDLNAEESQLTDFDLNTLLYINSELIPKAQKADKKKNKSGKDSKGDDSSQSSQETKDNKGDNSPQPHTNKNSDDNSSHGSSFEIIGDDKIEPKSRSLSPHSQHSSRHSSKHSSVHSSRSSSPQRGNPNPNLNPNPGLNPVPAPNPGLSSDSDSDSDDDMDPPKQKVPAFFPVEKFDGKDKTHTRQHWQRFQDFCDHNKLNFTDIPAADDIPAVPAQFDKIKSYFKLTLLDLARDWFERQTFTTADDIKTKFLNDFSPYGKTSHQWLNAWNQLQFNPDTDNFDEFIMKFNDLSALVGAPPEFKLMALKNFMPRDIIMALRDVNEFDRAVAEARDMMVIIQNPITNKMSALSLMQSRSPSPTPRPRSPSPGPRRQPNENRSRPKDRPNRPVRQPSQNPKPRSILRPPSAPRQQNIQYPRSRTPSTSRAPRCFNCNVIGHIARNCFTKHRVPRGRGFPQRFTPNHPPRKSRNFSNRKQVHFQPKLRYPNSNQNQGYGNKPRYQQIHNPQGYRQPYNYQGDLANNASRMQDRNYSRAYNPIYDSTSAPQYSIDSDQNYDSNYDSTYDDQTYDSQTYDSSGDSRYYPNADGVHLTDTFHQLNQ